MKVQKMKEQYPTSSRPPPTPERSSRVAPLIDRAPLPMVEVDGPSHIVCWVNAPFCRLLGKSKEELLGKPFAEIVCHGANCVPLLDRVYRTGESQTHAEREHSESDPAYWLYAMWPALDENEKPARVVIQLTKSVVFRQNVTEMSEALLIGGLHQHELREAAEHSNRQMQVEIAERKCVEAALRKAQAQLRIEAEHLDQTVAERTAELRTSVGELEAFSYSVAHDLRAPIRAIHGFTRIALEMSRKEVGPAAAELLHRIIKAAARMDGLIQDVLRLSQVIRQPIELKSVDVDTLVRALIEERPELSLPRAEINVDGPLLPMLGHETTLAQCLTNLLGNAVKFVELGVVPRVRVWTEELAAPTGNQPDSASAAIAGSPPAQPRWVRLWVEDQGIGIAPNAHKAIFEIFQRLNSSTSYEGSGIGLAIVRKAIERMSGHVGVESGTGKGSRFWLELPKG